MSVWEVTVKNKTSKDGRKPVIVDFMLFQTVQNLTEDAWSAAWKVAKVGCPGEINRIYLPSEVSFYVIDNEDQQQGLLRLRFTGPYSVQFGDTLRVSQKNASDVPQVKFEKPTAPKGQITVMNDSGNAKSLEFALFKEGKYGGELENMKLLSYKNILPGKQIYFTVSPTLYIVDVGGNPISEGDDFKAANKVKLSTGFQLYDSPSQRNVTMNILQKISGEIYFEAKQNTLTKHSSCVCV